MAKWLIIAFFCVGVYLGVMFVMYAILNKVDPYDEEKDWLSDGDCNKAVAALWPIAISFLLFGGVVVGLSAVMDLIRKYQKDGEGE